MQTKKVCFLGDDRGGRTSIIQRVKVCPDLGAVLSVSQREMAMAKRRIILVAVVFFSIAVFAVQTRSQTRSPNPTTQSGNRENSPVGAKVADDLTVRWSRVTYRKGLQNPSVPPEYQSSLEPESLSISFEIKMDDPRLLLGIAPDPTIERLADGRGNEVEINQGPPRSGSLYQQGIFFSVWLRDINLNHPERAIILAEHHPQQIEFDGAVCERLGGKIGLLRGHYEGFMAESIEYIDLPFRPSENWVRLTEEVQIRVAVARNVPDVYYYDIEQQPEDAISAKRVHVGEQLPQRLVVGRQMIGRNDSMLAAGGSGPGSIGGEGNGIGRAEGIRYVIAVNPTPVIIPFELRDVPVSAPAEATPPLERDPNRLKRLMSRRSVPGRIRMAKRYEADKTRSLKKPVPIAEDGKFFDVDWHSIGYTLNLYNPEVRKLSNSLNLSVSCKARILEPDLILGTCDEPIIERITDSNGRDVNILLADPRPDHMFYETPRYRHSPTLTQPSALVKLEGKARSAMQLPLQKRHFPTRKMELEPVRLTIRLDHRQIRPNQKEIGCIEGHFHALMVDSYKHVKVPFKASPRWVRLTSDLAIQVARAWHDGFKYRYLINERSRAGIDPWRLHVYCPLPDGILVERQFTGSNVPPRREDLPRGARRLPVKAGGNGLFRHRVDGVDCEVDTIDYRIAVGPTHYRIPIKIEHIPLP